MIIGLSSSPVLSARKALLVGIQDYQNLAGFSRNMMCDLKAPVNDVREIKKALCSIYGFSESDIKILLNKDATRSGIETAFTDWLVKGTKDGDLVIFYFSVSELTKVSIGNFIGNGNLDINIPGGSMSVVSCSWGPALGFYLLLISAFILISLNLIKLKKKNSTG